MQQKTKYPLSVISAVPRSLHPYDFAEDFDPFTLYQISLGNFNNIRRRLAAAPHHISFSELDKLFYYEFEEMLDDINKEIEDKNMKALQDKDNLVPVLSISKDRPISQNIDGPK